MRFVYTNFWIFQVTKFSKEAFSNIQDSRHYRTQLCYIIVVNTRPLNISTDIDDNLNAA